MKRLMIVSLGALCALLLGSCHGQVDEGVEVQLVPSTATIVANGTDAATFEVYYGANPVTAEAEVSLLSHPELGWSGNEFSTSEAGEYVFQATYRGMTSRAVKITAEEDAERVVSRFERHLCVMDLTGTWCAFCPEGFRKLLFYTGKAEWKDIVHILALHDGGMGSDPMALELATTISNIYNLEFPSFITDMRDMGSLVNNAPDIQPSFYRSVEEYPAHCDVKLATTLSEDKVAISATLFSESSENYSLAVWLYENGINAPQKDGSITHEEYEHNHVARALVSGNWRGDSLGVVAAEEESTKTYEVTLTEEWKTENMYVMALAIDKDGYVNNVAVCPLGESVDYKYLAK